MTIASSPHAHAEPERSQSFVSGNAVSVTTQSSTPTTDSSTTPELHPASGQPSTPKRQGYVSQRLHRMRFGYGVPVAGPMLSPIREVLQASAPSSSVGSHDSASDSQVARDEEPAVSSVLPLPSAVRIRRLANQVSTPDS